MSQWEAGGKKVAEALLRYQLGNASGQVCNP